MPAFLKMNPIPEWVNLWLKNANLFWRRYWVEKKSGRLPPNFEFKGRDHWKQKKAKPKGEVDGELSDGVDIRTDKKKKKQIQQKQDLQF